MSSQKPSKRSKKRSLRNVRVGDIIVHGNERQIVRKIITSVLIGHPLDMNKEGGYWYTTDELVEAEKLGWAVEKQNEDK